MFGGGLALYEAVAPVGGLGVTGDTSCTDHIIAWRVREALDLDDWCRPASAPPATII